MAGADPRDAVDFAPRHWPALRIAVRDLSWLLARGYAEIAAVKLVGDRFQFTKRQRMAIRRAACPPRVAERRRARRTERIAGLRVKIDGFNQLVTTERALAGGTAFIGQDTAVRDVASVHGTWRRTEGTSQALDRLCNALQGVAFAHWILDAPISNSGRLADFVRRTCNAHHIPCQVDLEARADAALLEAEGVLASADAALLDRSRAWTPLTERVLRDAGVTLLDLSTTRSIV
ncbi:MAG: DUF434 domain-containing protein [Myxococcota bacterium]